MNARKKNNVAGTVLIMAGGTGGHIFPALCVADYLRERGYHIEWLGTSRGLEVSVLQETGIPLHFLTASGLRGKGILKLLMAPLMILRASWQALRLLQQIKPCCVLGMGGYVTGPGGVAAKMLGKKLVIHEQNAVAGLSNGLLSRVADRVLEAFPDTFQESVNAIHTGNPVRGNILRQSEQKRRQESARVLRVLVLGGSLGAVALNTIMPAVLKQFSEADMPWVMHQTGGKNLEATAQVYSAQGITLDAEHQLLPFIDDMSVVYSWADVVICRAGATTVSELAIMGLPSILVPYPHAVDDHQTRNAQWLAEAGAAVVLPQEEMTAEKLCSILSNFSSNRDLLTSMSAAASSLAQPEATAKVASICMEMCDA
ncbi:MAG: undecaprenyldiphospho-muramoylpentapeptide beta-N-acetylglucosaminyltransferase [Pseudomonadales bacterium]|nr:undecaprenyldiphospho-muramoylpentapeptide beta-N-acetylglucosaminyltransferase [Pseudomonadales bacterium]